MRYTPVNNFRVKDTLGPDDPNKIIYGADLQDEFDAISEAIDEVEDIITDSGGFVEAPDDGKLYGRQSKSWAEVVIPDVDAPDWDDVTGKPTEFNPSAHAHVLSDVTGLNDALTNVDATSVKAGAFIETVTDATYAGVDATVDLSLANNFAVDFSQLGSFTLGLSGAPSNAGDAYGCTLTLNTANMTALTWDSKVKWPSGAAPALAADSTYVFTLMTTDGGTTFKGFVGGEAFA